MDRSMFGCCRAGSHISGGLPSQVVATVQMSRWMLLLKGASIQEMLLSILTMKSGNNDSEIIKNQIRFIRG